MGLVKEQWEFLKDVARLIKKAEELNIVLTGGELYRPQEMQEIYVSQGKSKTMKSNHRRRLAIDFNFFIDDSLTYSKEDIQELGDYWESLNPKNRWGGNWIGFVDVPHFERNV